jgi:4-alpha-glucanotransferase
MTWQDSYPYAAISVFALHPLYVNIESIAPFQKASDRKIYEKERQELNALEQMDFEKVLACKFFWFKKLYTLHKESTLNSDDFQIFYSNNKEWLLPYAAFCYLRDINNTCEYPKWKKYSKFELAEIEDLYSKEKDDINFYIFIQFHADKQLKKAKEYARKNGIVLKGDLPIGIYRYSADAWTNPHLYFMDQQAGAPPDDYAILGQNWGFPTYNWEEMAKDGFMWWKKRFSKLEEYFDALRIDHILGFFRIWQIPTHCVQGTLGLFNPRLPYSIHELLKFGLQEDIRRYTIPYIRKYYLAELFGEDTEFVIAHFLEEVFTDGYILKEKVNTQKKAEALFQTKEYKTKSHLLKGLLHLHSEVLLIQEDGSELYNPRITLNTTYSYKALDHHSKAAIDSLYHHYFFEKHNQYWKEQAYWKLPALLDASKMLICGEDLGMIPATVPEVMRNLNIIPLEIQRMPKGFRKFGNPYEYEYFSVCSPSCHDMSTVRGWWEANKNVATDYFQTVLHHHGNAPDKCSASLVEEIIQHHLNAPSILAIFPLQDLMGMHDEIKKIDAFSEQINEPSNPKHYWRFRIHKNMTEIKSNIGFVDKIKEMVIKSGRMH